MPNRIVAVVLIACGVGFSAARGAAPPGAASAPAAAPAAAASDASSAAAVPASPGPSKAAPIAPAQPASPEAERRLKKLSEELRCLVCQNQTLADSNAELAGDLRNQVIELISSGRSDEQIKSYLVERYGDFVLYRPPVQSNTLLLWFGPFGLLFAGVAIWWLVQRRSGAAGNGTAGSRAGAGGLAAAQSDDESLRRARALLDD